MDIARVPTAAINTGAISRQPGPYKVLAWNDLGMHCYNNDFSVMAVLPPYNTLWAQVVEMGGERPRIVTSGVKVSYSFADNKESASKTNFWQYAKQLFGADLPPNVGLAGKGLAGEMDARGDHFEAVGIPLTEFPDSNPTMRNPYQLADVVVTDASTGVELARTQVVVPTSSEMRCDHCHGQNGIANTRNQVAATDNVAMNILLLHDAKLAGRYPVGHDTPLAQRVPVLCAECHASNALNAAGVPGISSLSNAMHGQHAKVKDITADTNGCYNCHPGQTTQCLRDTMTVRKNFTCQKCHGGIDKVAQNPTPWLNEPRCDSTGCHQGKTMQTDALYRNSKGHMGIYCEGCHDSTHAVATSREMADAVKFYSLQGKAGTLNTCTVCHTERPDETFPHNYDEQDD